MRVAVFVTCEGASVRNKDREREREREREELRMLVGGGEIDTYGHAIHAAAIKSF